MMTDGRLYFDTQGEALKVAFAVRRPGPEAADARGYRRRR